MNVIKHRVYLVFTLLISMLLLTACTSTTTIGSRDSLYKEENNANNKLIGEEDASSIIAGISFDGGSGSADQPYLISTAQQLSAFRDDVNAGNTYAGMYVKLTANIKLNEGLDLTNEWIPIRKFSGVLDGQGYAITGLYVPDVYVLTARCIENGTMAYVESDEMGGDYVLPDNYKPCYQGSALIAELYGEVHRLTVSGLIETPHYNQETAPAASIAAINHGSISQCNSYITFYLRSVGCPGLFGGIASFNYGTITDCADNSCFYFNPEAYTNYDPISNAEIRYSGICISEWNGTHTRCINNAKDMGIGIPTTWNSFVPTVQDENKEELIKALKQTMFDRDNKIINSEGSSNASKLNSLRYSGNYTINFMPTQTINCVWFTRTKLYEMFGEDDPGLTQWKAGEIYGNYKATVYRNLRLKLGGKTSVETILNTLGNPDENTAIVLYMNGHTMMIDAIIEGNVYYTDNREASDTYYGITTKIDPVVKTAEDFFNQFNGKSIQNAILLSKESEQN